jgi:hypothetical protein
VRRAVAVVALVSALAQGHAIGAHKRVVITVSRYALEGLITLDLDGSEQTELMRLGSDLDKNGVLEGAELGSLKERLVQIAARPLKLKLSGFPVPVEIKETKLSLRGDRSAGRSGLSVAVLFESRHPHAVTRGMALQLTDAAPDLSEVAVEVFQRTEADAGEEAPVHKGLSSGDTLEVPLGTLGR